MINNESMPGAEEIIVKQAAVQRLCGICGADMSLSGIKLECIRCHMVADLTAECEIFEN